MFEFQDYLRAPSSVQLLLEMGDRLHIARSRLLAGTGLTLTRLGNVNGVVAPEEELGVIGNLLSHVADPAGLGLVVGLQHQLTAYGILGYGLMSSATGLEALVMAKRYLPLTYTFVSIRFLAEGTQGVVCFDAPSALTLVLQRFVVERAMAATSRVIGDIFEGALVLDEFSLTYPAPANPSLEIPNRMLGACVRFGARSNVLRFRYAQLARALPHANPVTAAMCERLCAELISQRRTTLTTTMIARDFLNAAPAGKLPSLGDLAERLNVSERTLKRRLQTEGSSFSHLLVETLQRRAEHMLSGDMSLTQIAEALGFADLSTFSQAYKRWTGLTPSVGRNALHKGNHAA